jgi:hypothetical protein
MQTLAVLGLLAVLCLPALAQDASQPECVVSDWTLSSPCSVSCGMGTAVLTRTILLQNSSCFGVTAIATATCHAGSCAAPAPVPVIFQPSDRHSSTRTQLSTFTTTASLSRSTTTSVVSAASTNSAQSTEAAFAGIVAATVALLAIVLLILLIVFSRRKRRFIDLGYSSTRRQDTATSTHPLEHCIVYAVSTLIGKCAVANCLTTKLFRPHKRYSFKLTPHDLAIEPNGLDLFMIIHACLLCLPQDT